MAAAGGPWVPDKLEEIVWSGDNFWRKFEKALLQWLSCALYRQSLIMRQLTKVKGPGPFSEQAMKNEFGAERDLHSHPSAYLTFLFPSPFSHAF